MSGCGQICWLFLRKPAVIFSMSDRTFLMVPMNFHGIKKGEQTGERVVPFPTSTQACGEVGLSPTVPPLCPTRVLERGTPDRIGLTSSKIYVNTSYFFFFFLSG